jgi:hypothetical protein
MAGRTGLVFLEDFDLGLARTIGAKLTPIELDGEVTQVFAVDIPGVAGPDLYQGLVPVQMSEAEDVYADMVLPQIVIFRTAINPAMQRWFPGGYEYQTPAKNAQTVTAGNGVQGPSLVERKDWTLPYDISYDIHIRCRRRFQADRILLYLQRYVWAYGQIYLTDSEGDERGYYAFKESVDQLNELTDISDRSVGHTISLRVEAELDSKNPYILKTQYNIVDSQNSSISSSGPGPGPGGSTGVSGPGIDGSGSPGGDGGRQFVSAGQSPACKINPYVLVNDH